MINQEGMDTQAHTHTGMSTIWLTRPRGKISEKLLSINPTHQSVYFQKEDKKYKYKQQFGLNYKV